MLLTRRSFLFASLSTCVAGPAWAISDAHPARKSERARKLWPEAENRIRAKFEAAGVTWPPARVLFRAFKEDDAFEVWASGRGATEFKRVHTYAITARSGGPGPKRQQGDGQVPEGFYRVSAFNPSSSYHLSLRVSYPNDSDKRRKTARDAGGDIMIHGSAVTIGCIPLGDAGIEEVFVAAAEAIDQRIEVQVFPGRLGDAAVFTRLVTEHPEHAAFWANLRTGLEAFEKARRPLWPRISKTGDYVF